MSERVLNRDEIKAALKRFQIGSLPKELQKEFSITQICKLAKVDRHNLYHWMQGKRKWFGIRGLTRLSRVIRKVYAGEYVYRAWYDRYKTPYGWKPGMKNNLTGFRWDRNGKRVKIPIPKTYMRRLVRCEVKEVPPDKAVPLPRAPQMTIGVAKHSLGIKLMPIPSVELHEIKRMPQFMDIFK
jgi:hypothetical protein